MSFAPLRKLFAWSLLAVMAVVVTPRGLLHHCANMDALAHHHGEGTTLHSDTHCAICDAAAPIASSVAEAGASLALPLNAVIVSVTLVREAHGHLLSLSARGPPRS